MYGLNRENGILYQHQERMDQIDKGIESRRKGTHTLDMVFDPRPAHTRRVIFPIIDCHQESRTPIITSNSYNQHNQFNPASSAPYSGYATYIDDENRLKNIFHPLQKGTAQNLYIPSSKSDLYNHRTLKPTSNFLEDGNERNLLFVNNNDFDAFNPNSYDDKIGIDMFNNNTRIQRRGVTGRVFDCGDDVNKTKISCIKYEKGEGRIEIDQEAVMRKLREMKAI
jgi:hypothetical protein